MNRKFRFEVSAAGAEFPQFWVRDEAADDWWDCSVGENKRLLAVAPGVVGVGTIRNGFVPVVLEIGDTKPTCDVSKWDQVNECSLELQSGWLITTGDYDDEIVDYGPRIDLEPGSYRVRVFYGNLKVTSDGFRLDHYKVSLWRANYGPLRVVKRAPLELIRSQIPKPDQVYEPCRPGCPFCGQRIG